MTTVDPKARHVWARTPGGIRCAYMMCNVRPNETDIAKLEAEEASRQVVRIEVRWATEIVRR